MDNYATNLQILVLISHWHANFSQLFCEFCHGLSCDIRTGQCRMSVHENFHVSRTSRQLVAKFLNTFKNFMQTFSLSCDVQGSVAKLSPRKLREFTMQNFCDTCMNVLQVWYDGRTTVLRKKSDHLLRKKATTIWRENKTEQHSYKCRATLTNVSQLSYE